MCKFSDMFICGGVATGAASGCIANAAGASFPITWALSVGVCFFTVSSARCCCPASSDYPSSQINSRPSPLKMEEHQNEESALNSTLESQEMENESLINEILRPY